MKIGYARVSTTEQSLNLQLDALHAAGCDVVYDDVISGKKWKRPGLDLALARVGQGDQIIVWRLDRLGRTFRQMVDIGELVRERGANIISLTEGIDTAQITGEMMFRLISVLADHEHRVTMQRTEAGLLAARTRGTKSGRKRKLSADDAIKAMTMMGTGMKAERVAEHLSVGRATVFRAIARQRFNGAHS